MEKADLSLLTNERNILLQPVRAVIIALLKLCLVKLHKRGGPVRKSINRASDEELRCKDSDQIGSEFLRPLHAAVRAWQRVRYADPVSV